MSLASAKVTTKTLVENVSLQRVVGRRQALDEALQVVEIVPLLLEIIPPINIRTRAQAREVDLDQIRVVDQTRAQQDALLELAAKQGPVDLQSTKPWTAPPVRQVANDQGREIRVCTCAYSSGLRAGRRISATLWSA